MHEQDTFCVGSVISHTELAFASTPIEDDDVEDVVLSQGSFGSDLIATPSEPGDCCGAETCGAVARIIQSCQARSGSRTAAEQLICAADMLLWLPRSFEGDSGTVNGGFISGRQLLLLLLLLPLLLLLLLPVPVLAVVVVVGLLPVEDTRSAASELDTAAVREDAAAGQTDLEFAAEEALLLPFELGGDQSSMSVTSTYLDG